MDKLRAMQWLVRLADVGSFTRVADQVGSSKSVVSKEISRLEADLGGRLLHRSTRHVQLTPAGEGYVQRARLMLSQLDEAEHFVRDARVRPRGQLKVNVPMALGLQELGPVFADFIEVYPDIELDLHLTDEAVDLVEQGFDVGFRASSRPLDSVYVGRQLTSFSYHVCVSPDYLARHGPITSPAQLSEHNCFRYSYFKGKNRWPIDDGVVVSGNLRANNVLLLMTAICQGQGIGFMPSFACREALSSGAVVEILQGTQKPQLTLHALYPARQFVPDNTRLCIEFLENWFQNQKA